MQPDTDEALMLEAVRKIGLTYACISSPALQVDRQHVLRMCEGIASEIAATNGAEATGNKVTFSPEARRNYFKALTEKATGKVKRAFEEYLANPAEKEALSGLKETIWNAFEDNYVFVDGNLAYRNLHSLLIPWTDVDEDFTFTIEDLYSNH